MKELVNIIHDDHKRRRFVEKLLRERLQNEGLIIEVHLETRINFCQLKSALMYDPFTFTKKDLDALVDDQVNKYKESVRHANLCAYGKEQITPRDILKDEYVHWEHLITSPEKSDKFSNDNSDACILP